MGDRRSLAREANESKLYFGLVWAIVVIGIIELLIGIDQPLVLIVISACVGGLMMFIYSGLLILTNRTILSGELRIRGYRLAVMVWSIVLFGTLSVLVIIQQYRDVTG